MIATAVVALSLWAALIFVGCLATHRARRAATPTPEYVRWLPLLPPVPKPTTPPFSQTTVDVSWFRDMPADNLGDDAIRLVCDDIDAHFTVIDGDR